MAARAKSRDLLGTEQRGRGRGGHATSTEKALRTFALDIKHKRQLGLFVPQVQRFHVGIHLRIVHMPGNQRISGFDVTRGEGRLGVLPA